MSERTYIRFQRTVEILGAVMLVLFIAGIILT